MEIHIGCSGFSYSDWNKKFYPEDLPKAGWLSYYSGHFNTVEINNTFYKFPTESQLLQWAKETPPGFLFTIKAPRYFTHLKKLNADDSFVESLDRFQNTIEALEEKLGCVLWQLPGNLHKDISRIEDFFSKLDKNVPHALELRHESWFSEPVYNSLRKNNISYCILSAPNALPEDIVITSKTAYLRFHGKSTWYNYLYSEKELQTWKNRIKELKNIERIFIYFNNDHNANAVKNATTLSELLHEELVRID